MPQWVAGGQGWLFKRGQFKFGSGTTSSGTLAVTFDVAFNVSPLVFIQCNDNSDTVFQISSVSKTGFTATARIFSTSSAVTGASTTANAYTSLNTSSAVTGAATTANAYTSLNTSNAVTASGTVSSSTQTHIPRNTVAWTTAGGVGNYSTSQLFAAGSSGGSPTTAFTAIGTSTQTISSVVTGGGTLSDISVVTSVSQGSDTTSAFVTGGSTTSVVATLSTGTFVTGGSTTSVVRTLSTGTFVTGWTNGGAVGFNWLAIST